MGSMASVEQVAPRRGGVIGRKVNAISQTLKFLYT